MPFLSHVNLLNHKPTVKMEIKFRGISKSDEKWCFGFFTKNENNLYFIGTHSRKGYYLFQQVKDRTVGQFTGFKDIYGVEIYAGDIIECEEHTFENSLSKIINKFKSALVSFEKGSFFFYAKSLNQPHNLLFCAQNIRVIGNIYDNPELFGIS
jgi:uncharacterized phage protein (TIGR01671 family)